uniref:Queuine tRNA-ribosyltransferase accessory subunit 2 n=1 Tax=Bicosoecida sp. CB-2014 TaxID=1486930 RepID=A0A7S1G9J2_9STRA|mmetsp:Transcript_2137/g.7015  ORF Transcript_2137/g.7015 Transcript_2137/m.7015 type:complete len:458 (+) Transcript_2137:22-1395(+)
MSSRMFAVLDAEVASGGAGVSGARLGRWLGMATPTALVHTQTGLPPHLTPDVLERIGEARGLALRLPHLLGQDVPVRARGVRINEYLNVAAHDTFMLTRDPRAVLIPRHSDKEAVLDTPSGRKKVTVADHCRMLEAFAPDVAACLSDELPATGGKRRAAQAVERTLKWLDATLETPLGKAAAAAVAAAEAGEGSGGDGGGEAQVVTQLLGVVVGGTNPLLRAQSAEETAKRPVAGFVLGGFGMGESAAQRAELLQLTISKLPATKPRVVVGAETPLEALEAVAAGVDVVDAVYPYLLARDRFASTFDFTWPALDAAADDMVVDAAAAPRAPEARPPVPTSAERDTEPLGDGVKLLLSESAFARDTRPLVPGCTCYTCTDHTRAYVHHLVNTHEMLADVLLFNHNLHHWLGFFAEVRRAIAAGRFVEYRAWMEETYGFPADDAATFAAPAGADGAAGP